MCICVYVYMCNNLGPYTSSKTLECTNSFWPVNVYTIIVYTFTGQNEFVHSSVLELVYGPIGSAYDDIFHLIIYNIAQCTCVISE